MSLLSQAQTTLWEPGDITEAGVEGLLGDLKSRQADFGELFFQTRVAETWVLENGIIKEGSYGVNTGVGIRSVSGEKTGFAYADEITMSALTSATEAARSIARTGGDGVVQAWKRTEAPLRYGNQNPIRELTEEVKIGLLRDADRVARAQDARIKEVTVSLAASHDVCLVAATDGTLAADMRPMIRMNVSVIAEDNRGRQNGSSGTGGRRSLTWLLEDGRVSGLAEDAARVALVNLDAIEAPAGAMPVVLGPGWCGVLLHEAVGHGLEGDFNRKGSSTYAGRMGEKVASEHCTIVDDGTLADRRGSLNIDDEGSPTQENVLIEHGILKGYMQDKLNARLMGVPCTGNGRREAYSCLPMPRMTNTFMRAGDYAPEEIIASVSKGIYAASFGGGSVDITSGQFVFAATEAYLIEDGKIGRPIKGATLIGNGPDVMTRVSMVGDDEALDPGVGVCGKNGQGVPVGVGQPTCKVDELTVGGTQA